MTTPKKKLSYFEKRQANNVWNAYNNTEKYQKELITAYQKANKEVMTQLYDLGRKAEKNGVLSRSEIYRGNYLKKLNETYTKTLQELGESLQSTGKNVMLSAGKEGNG